jgi:hypothetical protein
MLRNLNAIFDDLEVQGCCYRKMNDWRREAEYVSEHFVPKFSQYLDDLIRERE